MTASATAHMGIVVRVRWDELSSSPLQCRPVSALYYFGRDRELRLAPCPEGRVFRVVCGLKRWPVPGPTTPTGRSAASLALVVAAVCCLLRSKEFGFGDAVEALEGDVLDVDVQADHVGG